MVARHDTQKLQHLLNVLHFFPFRLVVAVSLLLDKVIRHNPEVTLEQFYLLICKICNLKQIDLIIPDIGLERFRHIKTAQQIGRLISVLIIAKVQNQRHNRIPVISVQLCTIFSAIVANDPQGHIRVRSCLVFQPHAGNADVLLRPALCHIPLNIRNGYDTLFIFLSYHTIPSFSRFLTFHDGNFSVNSRSLQDYEQGHKKLTSADGDVLLRLSTVLGCSITELLISDTIKAFEARAESLRFEGFFKWISRSALLSFE